MLLPLGEMKMNISFMIAQQKCGGLNLILAIILHHIGLCLIFCFMLVNTFAVHLSDSYFMFIRVCALNL